MIYSYHNTRIEKFSQILKNDKFICSHWLPKYFRTKFVQKLIDEYNKDKKKESEVKDLLNNYYNASISIRINIYQILLRSLSLKVTENGKALFKEYFNKDFKPEHLKEIERKIKKLTILFDASNTAPDNQDFDFDKYIFSLSAHLENKDLSKMFIYQLPMIEEQVMANINIKKNE